MSNIQKNSFVLVIFNRLDKSTNIGKSLPTVIVVDRQAVVKYNIIIIITKRATYAFFSGPVAYT